MLLRFSVENFRSFKVQQDFSMIASGKIGDVPHAAFGVPFLKQRVLPVAAVYGANASGKSTLFKALRFVERAVLESHNRWAPEREIQIDPFLLDPGQSGLPSTFEVDFAVGGGRYRYGFSVTRARFTAEWLYSYPQGKQQKWFDRDVNRDEEFKFSRKMGGANQRIKELTRSNSLFLSAAAQNNHPVLRPLFQWFAQSLRIVMERDSDIIEGVTGSRLMRNESLQKSVVEILKLADLGITGIQVDSSELPREALDVVLALAKGDPEVKKRIEEKGMTVEKISFTHQAGERSPVSMRFDHESKGTQSLVGLAPYIVEALSEGHVLCVDELDASLHPLIMSELIKLFCDPEVNARNAQLIFNTHDTNVLACGALRRDEIWFTSKKPDGQTELFALTDYHPRADENVARGYLQGRYGGVPFITGTESFFRQLRKNMAR